MNSRTTDAATLGRLAVFAGVAPDTLADLAGSVTTRRWAAGQFLFHRGDADDCLLVIGSGQVRLSLVTPTGRELVLKVLEQGDVLGEFALIDGLPRSTDAVALQPVTAMVVTRDQFLRVAQTRPDLPMALARYLCSLLRATNFQMESIALYDLQGRLVRFILNVIRQTHGPAPAAQVRIDLGLNQTDLAAALGATRPRVNNALQELIASGAIARDGSAILCNMAKLNALADNTTRLA